MITGLMLTAVFAAPPAYDYMDEAAAISFIESVGGRFTQNDAGQLTHVDLSNAWITDADLGKLVRLPHLENINLAYTKITDLGLEQLIPLENVKVLNLHYCEYIGDVGIAHLKQWRNLEYLNLRGTKVTSTVFEHVSKMTTLQFLDVGHSRVSDELFEELADLDKLESFSFGGNKMSGVALPLLKLLPSLRRLDVGTRQRTDSGQWYVAVSDFNINHIAQLEQLEVLELNRADITDRGIAQLASVKNLRKLDLGGTRVTAMGIAALTDLPELRQLILWQADGIDDDAVAELLKLKKLAILDLSRTKVSAEALARLAEHPGLQQLFIGDIELSEEQIASLRKALPECRISWWTSPEIDVPESARER